MHAFNIPKKIQVINNIRSLLFSQEKVEKLDEVVKNRFIAISNEVQNEVQKELEGFSVNTIDHSLIEKHLFLLRHNINNVKDQQNLISEYKGYSELFFSSKYDDFVACFDKKLIEAS